MSDIALQTAAELRAARKDIERLTHELADCQQSNMTLRRSLDTIELAVRGSNDGFWSWDMQTNEAYISPRWKEILGYQDHELANHIDTFTAVLHAEDYAHVWAAVRANIDHGQPYAIEARMRHKDGSYRWVYTRGETMRDKHGQPLMMAGALTDIDQRKAAEAALLKAKLQEEVISAQNAILAELSTPLIPLTADTMVMPLIGTIDTRRAQHIIETVLQGVAVNATATVVLDITGVKIVDTQVANVLIHATRAVNLLGAKVILTGIRPEVAQTIVGLGIDLGRLITYSSLQQGIAHALRH